MNINRFRTNSRFGRLDLERFQPAPPRTPAPRVFTPRPPVAAAPAPAPTPVAQPTSPPAGARPTPNQVNLLTFGGDRKQAVETLIASGAKPENPKTGFFKDVFRKIFGGTTTKKKAIGPTQTLTTKVRNKNFEVKELRLSTREGGKTRHIDFHPNGGEVKDIGKMLAGGEVKRMFDQKLSRDARGRTVIESNYFDPKSGRQLLRVTEASRKVKTTKFGTVESKVSGDTFRQIEVLGTDGSTNGRYTFDHGRGSYRFENLDKDGTVLSSYNLSRKTDFHQLVERLGSRSSGTVAFGGGGGGGGGGRTHPGVRMQAH